MAEETSVSEVPVRHAHCGFRAESRSGGPVALSDGDERRYASGAGRERAFVQTGKGVAFNAEEMLLWYLRRKNARVEQYCPHNVAKAGKIRVEFPIGFSPGSFHIETDEGPVELKRLVLFVEFSAA